MYRVSTTLSRALSSSYKPAHRKKHIRPIFLLNGISLPESTVSIFLLPKNKVISAVKLYHGVISVTSEDLCILKIDCVGRISPKVSLFANQTLASFFFLFVVERLPGFYEGKKVLQNWYAKDSCWELGTLETTKVL